MGETCILFSYIFHRILSVCFRFVFDFCLKFANCPESKLPDCWKSLQGYRNDDFANSCVCESVCVTETEGGYVGAIYLELRKQSWVLVLCHLVWGQASTACCWCMHQASCSIEFWDLSSLCFLSLHLAMGMLGSQAHTTASSSRVVLRTRTQTITLAGETFFLLAIFIIQILLMLKN